MSERNSVRLLWDFLKVRKRWWLLPIALVVIALGVMLALVKTNWLWPIYHRVF